MGDWYGDVFVIVPKLKNDCIIGSIVNEYFQVFRTVDFTELLNYRTLS